MKQLTIGLAAVLLAATPLQAEQDDGSILPSDEELEQLGDIAQSWMKRFAEQMSPMVEQLKEMVDDLDAYQPPEMLENGDIIIRRKPEHAKPDEDAPSISL